MLSHGECTATEMCTVLLKQSRGTINHKPCMTFKMAAASATVLQGGLKTDLIPLTFLGEFHYHMQQCVKHFS